MVETSWRSFITGLKESNTTKSHSSVEVSGVYLITRQCQPSCSADHGRVNPHLSPIRYPDSRSPISSARCNRSQSTP